MRALSSFLGVNQQYRQLKSMGLMLRRNSVALIKNQPPPPGGFNGLFESQGPSQEAKRMMEGFNVGI